METSFHADASTLLASNAPPEGFVLELVRWLDLQMADAPEGLARQMLVRAMLAAGRALPQMPTVLRTLRAAEEFVADPTDVRYAALQAAATDSYPFGPGDGCYAIEALGVSGCNPGSGCRSGAGCLSSIADHVGYAVAAGAIRRELTSWLEL